VSYTEFDVLTIQTGFAEFDDSNTPSSLPLISGTTRPSRILGIMARNPDSIDHTLRFTLSVSGDGVDIGEVVVPAGSGVAAAPPVDCLTVLAPPQIGALLLPALGTFAVHCEELILTGELDVIATFGIF
jgi:hypothetical protein